MQLSKCWLLAGLVLAGSAAARGQEPQKPVDQVPLAEQKPQLEKPLPIVGDSLYAPLAIGQGPESLKTKLNSYLVISFGPRAIVSPAVAAGFHMAFPNYNYPNDWHQGMQGFGRQYGSSYGSKVAMETGRYSASILLHEDFRYRPIASHNVLLRIGHAVGYTFIDKSDSGAPRLAVANLVGAAAGGFTPNLWLPDGFNNPRHGATRTLTKLGAFAGQNVAREFAPEIFKVFQTLHLPLPRVPLPPWWTKDITVARPSAIDRPVLDEKP
jgi:hypothetical protein